MTYNTKVILVLLAETIARCETVEQAYNTVRRAANSEGVILPEYEEFRKELGMKV